MKKAVYIIAFTHLIIITLTIFHVLDKVVEHPWLEKPVTFYCSLNYSVWRYGFFSPDVGRSNEVEIRTYDTAGVEKKYSTLKGFDFFLANEDLAKRFYGFKVYNASDTMIQDLCARSVATRMMNMCPGAIKVSYTLRSIRYPTMNGFLKKEPVQVNEIYTTDFILSDY